jgi:single-strand DNA-binding protein
MNINKVIICGNLTRDPQTKTLPSGKNVCEFGLAINRRYKGKDGELKEETTFVEVQAWDKTADLVGKYLLKGSEAYVEGRLSQETWEDKTTGQKRSKTRVVAENVQFGAKKDRGEASAEEAPSAPAPAPRRPAAPAQSEEDSEPPF